ncbi:MAG: hypothetical protein IH845_05260 [Nanoarchaeota archaeon]|nr:hypothetical protein [Nanoarchaeota archaeon]
MNFKKYEDKKWFKQIKENKDFKSIDNRIEVGKYIYDKDTRLLEWFIGIGLIVLFSVNVGNLLNHPTSWIRTSASIFHSLSLFSIVVSILLHMISDNRHRVAIRYLYLKKDKEESKKETRKR